MKLSEVFFFVFVFHYCMQDPFPHKNKAVVELILFKSLGLLPEIAARKVFPDKNDVPEEKQDTQYGNPLPRPLPADVLMCPLYPCEYPGPWAGEVQVCPCMRLGPPGFSCKLPP